MDDRRLRRILKQHVETDRLLGVEAVPRSAIAPAPPLPTAAVATEAPPPPAPSPARPQPAPAAPRAASTPLPLHPPGRVAAMSRDEKAAALAALDENEVRGCTKCGLCHSRTQTVFGEGAPDAQIMFIGEGPGQTEDELGRPFVGRAGELLDKMITAMGLRREDVFIANVVKCRPPNNRTPSPIEADACFDYLRRQIEIVGPEAIVTLGGPAAKTILQTTEGITRLRGNWGEYRGVEPPIPVMPTFHPAYLLRAYTKDNRAKVWSDLKAVLERIGKETPSER